MEIKLFNVALRATWNHTLITWQRSVISQLNESAESNLSSIVKSHNPHYPKSSDKFKADLSKKLKFSIIISLKIQQKSNLFHKGHKHTSRRFKKKHNSTCRCLISNFKISKRRTLIHQNKWLALIQNSPCQQSNRILWIGRLSPWERLKTAYTQKSSKSKVWRNKLSIFRFF